MTRDMTKREFIAALERHGWKLELLWVVGTGKDGHTTGVGIVINGRTKKIMRRATLASALRSLRSKEDS